MMNKINNSNGFTLIEVMITMVILSVGILGMSLMQIRAMDANSSAFSRTTATAIAQNFLEELTRLPFDDINLNGVANADLNAGAAVGAGAPTPADAAHQYLPANFDVINNSFTTSGSDIVINSGRAIQIFWNVDKTPIIIGTGTFTPYCTIRMFLYWDTPSGRNHLTLTTIKYNNVKV
jgi:type IV pilus assembly protein PilV